MATAGADIPTTVGAAITAGMAMDTAVIIADIGL
jgi:hypothetical protein